MKRYTFLLLALALSLSCWQCTQETQPDPPPGQWTCSTLIPEDYASLERSGLPPDPLKGVAAKTLLWPLGSTRTVGFIGGTQIEKDSVRRAYAEISQIANLNFSFPDVGPYDIRVAFANSVYWS